MRRNGPTGVGVVFLGLLGALALMAACSGDEGPTRERVTALRGAVTDVAGMPLAGVSITAGGVNAASGPDGRYNLPTTAGPQVARYERDGYVTVSKSVEVIDLSPTQLDVAMLVMAPALPLDATVGGIVLGANGASLSAPPGAFVDGAGAVVSGMVSVHLTTLDPSSPAQLRTAPGDFSAEDGSGTRVVLESLGMMDVTVRQGTETLGVAPGGELEIGIPVASAATAPDAELGFWSFDEARALWVDEGLTTYDVASRTYVARVRHLSLWNADKRLLATCICGTVVERGAGALPGGRVVAAGLDYFGSSEATSAEDGTFCLVVRQDSRVSVAAYHASGGGTAREVATGSGDSDVPPRRGDPRCVDIGSFEVERDVFRGLDDTVTDCADVADPFEDACGRELWSIFECYQPSGECTTRVEADGSSTTTFANGARNVSSIDPGGTMISTALYSSADMLCATQTTVVPSGPASDMTLQYTTPAGRTFSLTIPEAATGDMLLTCPDGSMGVVTPTQRQAFEACSGGGRGGMTTTCTVEGGMPGSCTGDADCAAIPDGVCCDIPMAGRYCVDSATCAML